MAKKLKYGSWIETCSGEHLDFLNPDPNTIILTDIAFALSNLCRYTGHVPFYSVAEHSVYVASRLPKEWRLAGLFHDAAEAYLGDVNSPLKQYLPKYQGIEKNLEKVIMEKFLIEPMTDECRKAVKLADMSQLKLEASVLLPSRGVGWNLPEQPDDGISRPGVLPRCLPPDTAMTMFLACYDYLTKDEETCAVER